MKKSFKLLSRYWVLVLLVSLYVLNRLPLLFFQTFAFTFDHGKDSLAVMDLVTSLSPKLIGPWTSIPGLYFGPGWYYLLAPLYWLLNFHPFAGPLTMMLLGLVQLIVVYKYFGKLAALIVVATPLWFMTTTSAWNPYPLTLITWLILVLLNRLKISPTTKRTWLFLGLSMGFGFHFSTAFAVLYPILVAISLWLRKIKVTSVLGLICLVGFLLPFIPQFAFEIRHNFSETKAVLTYVRGDVSIETQTRPNPLTVLYLATSEVKSAVFAGITGTQLEDKLWLLCFVTTIIWASNKYLRKLRSPLFIPLVEFLTWLLLSVFWFSATHYNSWYVLGIMPVVVVLFTQLSRQAPRLLVGIWVMVLVCSPFISVTRIFLDSGRFSANRSFLPVKLKTIETVYEIAGDKPFTSYQYAPHIYDFDWQYLYFWHAANGERLPSEFAYEPNVVPYITEKTDLLNHFVRVIDVRKPELIFYIVEKPIYPSQLVDWWQRQQFERIVETIKISNEVTLYVAEPKVVQY